MNLKALSAHLQHLHRDSPQIVAMCNQALHELDAALSVLARYGHHLHVAEGHVLDEEWPKTVYHYRAGAHLVRCQADLDELGPGWFDSPATAMHQEGLDVQFAGRGGIRRRSLPANGAAGSPVDLMPQGWKEKAIRDFLTRDDFLARDGD